MQGRLIISKAKKKEKGNEENEKWGGREEGT